MENTNELFMHVALGWGMILLATLFLLSLFYLSRYRKRKKQYYAQKAKLASRESLLLSSFQNQEEERARVAKDLHDEVSSKLQLINLYLHTLKKKAPDAESSISEMRSVLNETIDTSSRISQELLPPTLENFGLHAAIQEFAELIEQTHNATVVLKTYGERPSGNYHSVELTLFRILQELMTDSLRYSCPCSLYIELWQSKTRFLLIYRNETPVTFVELAEKQRKLRMEQIESRLQMIEGGFNGKMHDEKAQLSIEVKAYE